MSRHVQLIMLWDCEVHDDALTLGTNDHTSLVNNVPDFIESAVWHLNAKPDPLGEPPSYELRNVTVWEADTFAEVLASDVAKRMATREGEFA